MGDRLAVRVAGAGAVTAGDVVVVREPAGWGRAAEVGAPPPRPTARWRRAAASLGLAGDPQRRYLVKRVIAVGGQRVICCDPAGRVVVDGRALDETYVAPDGTAASGPGPTGEVFFDVTVPVGAIWLQGDHRAVSDDSRSNGPVPERLVQGQVMAKVWPWKRVARVAKPLPVPTHEQKGRQR